MSSLSGNDSGVLITIAYRLYGSIQEHYLLYFLGVALLSLPGYVREFRLRQGVKRLPMVGTDNTKLGEAIREGIERYPNDPFQIPTIGQPMVIYPLHMSDEYKDLAEERLSVRKVLFDAFAGGYTQLGQYSHAMLSAVQIDLTRNVAKTMNTLHDEVKFAFEQNIPASKEWQPLQLEPKLLRIVALMNGRVLVGLPLSREEAWIEATTQYTARSYKFSDRLKSYPFGTRWLVGPFLYRATVKPHQQTVARMLKPLINENLQRHSSLKTEDDEKSEVRAGEMIGWTMSYYKSGEATYTRIALDQLMTSFSSIHTSTVTLLQAIYDLASRPEYAKPLREEIETYSVNGKLDKYGVSQLRKLDSFLKESQRLNPQSHVALIRKTTGNVKLSVGPELPKNTVIAVSAFASNNGPDIINPEKFDGFRFEKLRSKPGNETRFQMAGTGRHSTGFGFGDHACPGRFFAVNEMKIVFAHLLGNFDLKLKDGEERPTNLHKPTGTMYPDPATEILIRIRNTEE